MLGVAAWWSIQLARADWAFRTHTPEGTAQALALVPDNTTYLAFAALQAEYVSGDSQALLLRITHLNPTSSSPLIRLGLAAEIRGDFQEAERYLQRAYEVDKQFEPRWTLANFYLRQQRLDDFWHWIYSSLEIQVGDRTPVFDLLLRVSSRPDEILSRAIPADRKTLAAYLVFMLNHPSDMQYPDGILPVVRALSRAGGAAENHDLLGLACSRLLESGRYDEAIQVWTSMGNPPPSGITDPEFKSGMTGQGFDWMVEPAPGITHAALDTGGHRVRLSGSQPESVEILRQVVGGLRPGSEYQLRWQVGTHDLVGPLTGLEWRVADAIASPGQISTSSQPQAGEMKLKAQAPAVVLTLHYRRPSGQARESGSVDLLRVDLQEIKP